MEPNSDMETNDAMTPVNAARSGRSSNIYVVVFGIVMLAGLLTLAWIGRPPRSVMSGKPLPRIDLQPLLHADTPISKESLEGKIAVLHFWGTWCPPCRLEFPEFAKLAEEFSDSADVQVVSVSCSGGVEYDLDDLKAKTEAFLSEYPPIPTYSDSAALTRSQLGLLSPSGTFGYPTTVVVDRSGTIVTAIEGYYEGEMEKLTEQIKAL